MTIKPNVVFFFTDDQRFDTIHALGNQQIRTPNLDRLVSRGTAFTQAHIPGGTIGAVCMPSRAMLHTGRSLFHIQEHGRSIPEEHVLMGEAFAKAGYATCGIGKWHNGTQSFQRSFGDGAEIFFGGMEDHWNVPSFDYHPDGAYDSMLPIIRDRMHSNDVEYRKGDRVRAGYHSTDLFTEAAVNWIRNASPNNPYFLYISYMAPHDPRSMPQKYMDLYEPATIPLPENYAPEHTFDYGVRNVRDERLASYPRTEEEIRTHLAEYYAMISHLDQRIGDVMKALEQTGQYDNTIFIFAGDNGLALGQHGLMGKQSCYEHSIRVPLLFSGPGIPKGERRDNFVYLYDIFPTLCELTGISIPATVEGQSLVPFISDTGEQQERKYMFFAYADLVRAVKNQEYKLILYREAAQLFCLTDDPHEQTNLYGRKDYEGVVRELMHALTQHSERSGDVEHPTGRQFWRYRAEADNGYSGE